jgi:hypothetical protein
MSKFFGWLRKHASSIYFMFLGLALIAVVGEVSELAIRHAGERQQVISEHPQCLLLDKSKQVNYYYMVCEGNVVIVKPNS